MGSVLENPPVLGTLIGVLVAAIPPARNLLVGSDAPLQFISNGLIVLGKGCPCATNLTMAASLGLQLKKLKSWRDVLGGGSSGISRRTLMFLVFGKIIVTPALIFCLLLIFHEELPPDRWFRLLLFMETCTPTANNVVTLATVLQDQDAAQLLALTTIAQFI